jgi:hypothetical protein
MPLFAKPLFDVGCPATELLPAVFVSIAGNRISAEHANLYRAALHSAVRSRREFAHVVIESMSRHWGDVLSPPLSSPFATVVSWLSDALGDLQLFQVIYIVFEALVPPDGELEVEMRQLKQPLSSAAASAICKMFASFPPAFRQVCCRCPAALSALACQSHNLPADCRTIDWFALLENSHLTVFLRLLLPETLSSLVPHFTDVEMLELIAPLLRSRLHLLTDCISYYLARFPSTTLAQAFCIASLELSEPVTPTLFFRMRYLIQTGHHDDALGLFASNFPQLSDAVQYHMLSLFSPAIRGYFDAMSSSADLYFHCLLPLRCCAINSTLAWSPKLCDSTAFVTDDASLPFWDDFAPGGRQLGTFRFTTFLSSSHIPYIMFAAMVDEVVPMQRLMRPQSIDLPDALCLSSMVWVRGFDKYTAMASHFGWKNAVWRYMTETQNSLCCPHLTQISDSQMATQGVIATLLARSGLVGRGLKLYQTASGREFSHFHVSSQSLPRLVDFASRQTIGLRLTFKTALAVQDYSAALDCAGSSLHAWLRLVTAVHDRLPDIIDPIQLTTRIITEMDRCASKDRIVLGTLLLHLLRNHPDCQECLTQAADSISADSKKFWAMWIGILFSQLPTPPIPFLDSIFRATGLAFLLSLKHVQSSGVITDPAYERELMTALRESRSGSLLQTFDFAFDWVRECEPDILKLDMTARSHFRLNHLLVTNENEPMEDLVEFCAANPPIFRTSVCVTRFFSAIGFKFPILNGSVVGMSIEADGSKEGVLRCLTMRGEYCHFTLVSPIIFRFSVREFLFYMTFAKHVYAHPSSQTRPLFMTYPRSCRIHLGLTMVENHGLVSFRDIAKPLNVARELLARRKEIEASPRSVFERRKIEVDNRCLLQYFVRGASGNLNNFIFHRHRFAAFFAGYCVFHALFSPVPAPVETFVFFEDKQTFCMPGFLEEPDFIVHVPLTDQLERVFPKHVLNGSFAATWHIVVNSLLKHLPKFRLITTTLMPRAAKAEQMHLPIDRLEAMGVPMGEDTDKTDDPFHFAVIEHLIQCSNNVFKCQERRIDWI